MQIKLKFKKYSVFESGFSSFLGKIEHSSMPIVIESVSIAKF